MFEKSRVVGENRNPLFAELNRLTGQHPAGISTNT